MAFIGNASGRQITFEVGKGAPSRVRGETHDTLLVDEQELKENRPILESGTVFLFRVLHENLIDVLVGLGMAAFFPGATRANEKPEIFRLFRDRISNVFSSVCIDTKSEGNSQA